MIAKNISKYILVIIVIFISANILNYFYDFDFIKKKIPENIKGYLKKTIFYYSSTNKEIEALQKIINDQEIDLENYKKKINLSELEIIKLQKTKNFVNQLIFPQTQLIKVNYSELELDLDSFDGNYLKDGEKASPYYLEIFENELILFSKKGQIYFANINEIKEKKLIKKKILNNLDKFNNIEILDALLLENKVYLSIFSRNNACNNYIILEADYNNQKLLFKEFFNFTKLEDCTNMSWGLGGRLQIYNFKEKEGILLSSNQIYFIDFENKEKIDFASGFRNPQGLLVTRENVILASDHGPRGGDEINKILYQKNYGWPYASYGEEYLESFSETDPLKYEKKYTNHSYEQPIFSFLIGIAPSQIIQIESSFSKKWSEDYIYLLSSLRSGSLYRVIFSENYNRVIGYEKIYINRRIRDIIYDNSTELIFLAIEDNNGFLGVISNDKN
ncbi:PQQ-dependent sugar dehydrogenase [Candidatus Pelagibacter bacterium nBUS_30]|uniref:PQQ-dependent sugar dehydrogenase n=1 Tax=Candidatus Pelagibacter bacterium nBUS_30 TaxID=3374191 RepID=UPI003EBD32DF